MLLTLLMLAWFIYTPGLSGGFLFDDFINIPALGTSGSVDNRATFWRYVTSGTADPTGRPTALLSFLLDAQNWPAEPRPFLVTNLTLHLLNGLLLFFVLRQLGRVAFGVRWKTKDITESGLGVLVKNYARRERRWVPAFAGMTRGLKGRWIFARSLRVEANFAARAGLPGDVSSLGHSSADNHSRLDMAAVLGASLWLLHPLLVSTTLYIVQREAMLPATFVLLGLLAWLRGRRNLSRGHTISGLAWLVLGLGACTALAVLSKANGILLPALALVIEYALLRPRHAATLPQIYRRAMMLLGWLPTLLVAGYLLYQGWSGLTHGVPPHRPWTLGQRLLTEPRVLADYLQLLWLPRPFTPGLFNDQIQASTSLMTPWTTVPCLLAVLGLIAGACLVRKRAPAVALAVLFYFVGQALESTTVPLELYFEHRNYLPAMLMFWPLALWLCGVRQGATSLGPDLRSINRRLRSSYRAAGGMGAAHGVANSHPNSRGFTWAKGLFAVVAVMGLAAMTHARASLWGNQHDQALLWATLNPQSPRAQAYAAQAEIAAGHPQRAIVQLKPVLAAQPDEVQLALNLFGAECEAGHVEPQVLTASRRALRTTRNPGSLLVHWFERLIDSADHPTCPQANLTTAASLLEAGLANPRLMAIEGRRQDLYYLKGRVALAQHDADLALDWFNRALKVEPRPGAALRQAALLGAAGYPARGLTHLSRFADLRSAVAPPRMGMARLHAWVLAQQGYWQHEIDRLRSTLQSDIASGANGAPAARAAAGTGAGS